MMRGILGMVVATPIRNITLIPIITVIITPITSITVKSLIRRVKLMYVISL